MEKVRIVVTSVYEYEPEFEDGDFYTDNDVKTVLDAVKADKNWFEKQGRNDISNLIDIAGKPKTNNIVWQVIGDTEDDVAEVT